MDETTQADRHTTMTPLWQLALLYPHFPKQKHISLKFIWQVKRKSMYVLNLIGSIAILWLLSQNFSETTLLQVQHNFGVIFKFVFSLFFFHFSYLITKSWNFLKTKSWNFLQKRFWQLLLLYSSQYFWTYQNVLKFYIFIYIHIYTYMHIII